MNRPNRMSEAKRAAILATADAVTLPRCVYRDGAPGKSEALRPLHATAPEPGTEMGVPEMMPVTDDPADWGEGAA